MFRPGKNPKDQTHADETADYTPQAPSSQNYGGSSSSTGASGASAGGSYDHQSGPQTPTNSRAVTESESLARDIKEGTLSGFVGNGTTLTGEANFKGMLRVDGHLSGRVSSADGTLIISTNGQVDANVEVAVAQIYGTVNGDIIATKRIEMGRVAKVNGNIQTPALVIEHGALFEGSCRMVQLKEAQDEQGKSVKKEGAATAAASSASTAGSSPGSTPGATPGSTPGPTAGSTAGSTTGSTSSPPSSSPSSPAAGSTSSYGSSPSKDKSAPSSGVTNATGTVS